MAKRSRQPTLTGFEEPARSQGESAASKAQEPRFARQNTDTPAANTATGRTDGWQNPPDTAAQNTAHSTGSLVGKTVYVVDSHSLIYQVFHALPEMSGPNGQPVGAVQGFVRDLLDLIEVRGADYLICAFDHSERTFRNDIYDKYKADRDEMPADLQLQIPVIYRFLEALGLLTLTVEGYEADDILATVARQVEAAGGRCLLVTADKDCRQLLSDQVQIYNIRKNEIFDDVALQATWGIRPDQVIDFQALVGDPTDNIPGVPLIGPKIAQELLTKYGTLEEVLAHAHEVSGAKRKENLLNGREIALKSRELAALRTDVPLAFDWTQARSGKFRPAELAELCRECGFRQLARRIEALAIKLGISPSSPTA